MTVITKKQQMKGGEGMGRKKRYIDIDKVQELRGQGLSYSKVSKEMGIPIKTIQNRMKSLGLSEISYEKTCTNCEHVYISKYPNNIYCSSKCKQDYNVGVNKTRRKDRRETIPCRYCEKDFKTNSKSRTYCSEDCKENHMRKEQSIKIYCKECRTCFKLFVTNNPLRESCSMKCTKNYKYISNSRKNRRLKKCKNCNVWFWNKVKNIVCCSEDCSRKYKNELTKLSTKKRFKLMKSNGKIDKDITITKLINIYDGKCYLCQTIVSLDNGDGIGKSYANIEHIVPISRGGTHTWENVSLSCSDCNSRKGTMTLEEYLDSREIS